MKKANIYLVAQYVTRPRDPRKTHIAGYMKDPNNFQYDERVQIATRLRNQDLYTAKVILNLSTKTVDKNSFNNNKNFDEMFKYFFKGYHKYITEIMVKLDAEYFNSMLDEMQGELDKENKDEKVSSE
jgi:hypothetical protein